MSRDFSERDIHLAIDGEMPPEDRAAYEDWLDASPDMKARAARLTSDRDALRSAFADVADEPLPARWSALLRGDASGPPRRAYSPWWFAAAAVLLLAVGAGGGFVAGGTARPDAAGAAGERFVAQAIEAHVLYAAEKRHVVEVGADESEHLLGWLSNRVGLELVAPNLTTQGLQFLGGRLLPLDGRKAAQFMYQDGAGNRVSLYVAAEKSAGDTGFRLASAGATNAYYWLDGGYGCALAGDLPAERLRAVSGLAYSQLLGGTPS